MKAAPSALQGAVNVLGFALLVWFGGPLLAVADVRPLETQAARLALLLIAACTEQQRHFDCNVSPGECERG